MLRLAGRRGSAGSVRRRAGARLETELATHPRMAGSAGVTWCRCGKFGDTSEHDSREKRMTLTARSGRQLIVNGDDFGLSPQVNAGILHAHRHGILTDTSLMI